MATTKKTTAASKPKTKAASTTTKKTKPKSKPRKRNRDPYANKTIAFDTLSKSFERNAEGTFGFFAVIFFSVIFIFLFFGAFNSTPILKRILRLMFFSSVFMPASTLNKKPNGLPLIAIIIYATMIFIFFVGLVLTSLTSRM